jgi:hypothetical protein
MATESLLRGADFLAKVGLCSSGCLTKEKQSHSTRNLFWPYLSRSSQSTPSLIFSVNSLDLNEVGESYII